MMAQNYRDLIAWQKAMQLVNAVCEVTDTFPKPETYSVTDQIRRAAVSIPSNTGEGKTHYSKRECIHLLRHCRASVAELETQVLIAQRRNYRCGTQAADLQKQAEEVSCILSGLIDSLKEQAP
jgi:four helix bundle protein